MIIYVLSYIYEYIYILEYKINCRKIPIHYEMRICKEILQLFHLLQFAGTVEKGIVGQNKNGRKK